MTGLETVTLPFRTVINMDFISNIINTPLGYVIRFFADIFNGSFAASVFAFTLLINIILIPLSIKSQKSSVQQTRIKPKLDELKRRYGDDKQKYNEAMQKLYQEENISMSGGCLPMILRLVLMMSIYWLILSPLTYMTGIDSARIKNVTSTISAGMSDLKEKDADKYKEYIEILDWNEKAGDKQNELIVVRLIRNDDIDIHDILSKKQYEKIEEDFEYIKKKDTEVGIDYNLFTEKLDLTQKPKFSFDIFHKAQWIWLIPLLAFAAQMLTSLVSMRMQKKLNPEAPSMAGMMLTMPLLSLFIGFTLPGGVGFYWICSSIIGGFIQTGVQQFYGPHKMLARERAKELSKQLEFEDGQIKKISAQNTQED